MSPVDVKRSRTALRCRTHDIQWLARKVVEICALLSTLATAPSVILLMGGVPNNQDVTACSLRFRLSRKRGRTTWHATRSCSEMPDLASSTFPDWTLSIRPAELYDGPSSVGDEQDFAQSVFGTA
jgi:hypothetical protein